MFSPAFFSFVLDSFFPSSWFSLIWPVLHWCLSPRSSLYKHKHTFFSLLPCKPLFSGTYFPSAALTSGCFKIEEPLQQYQLHLLQAGPSSSSPCQSSPALGLQPVPHGAPRHPVRHRLGSRLSSREGWIQLSQKMQRLEGIKFIRFRGFSTWVLARDKSSVQNCEKQLSCSNYDDLAHLYVLKGY